MPMTIHTITSILRWTALSVCLSWGHLSYGLEADFDVTRFQTPDKSYVELFMYILGSSVSTVTLDSVQSASVNVTYFISTNGEIVTGDRYNLVSTDRNGITDFMDLRRHFLNPGTYVITVELTDNYDTLNSVTLSKRVEIMTPQVTLTQSDIKVLGHVQESSGEAVWDRNGWRMTPLPYAWYRAEFDQLYFYQEYYHTDVRPGTDFYIQFSITPKNTPDKILLQGFKRMKPKQVNTLLQAVDITGLGSGEYLLRVGVFDQSRTELSIAEKVFMRSNPVADELYVAGAGTFFEESFTKQIEGDSLRYALKALAPKVSQTQTSVLNYLLQKGEPENQRRFLHQYWVEANPMSPELAYQEYMKLAVAVDKEYHSAFGYGFETDRGHILMKYGFPDDIIAVEDEPSAPPYEIWFYHNFPATNQGEVRFLFYNPSLAGGDYRLLHSTATGEVQNPRWQLILYSDAITEPEAGDFINARDVKDNFNRRAVEYFND